MHFVEAKSILSSNNGMNIYRGCTHNCIYCDSRSKRYNMNHDFTDVEIKANSLELLKKALKRKKQKCMIGIGAMSDPYIPEEKNLKYTRKTLELINSYGFGFTCITKSDLILRDLNLIKEINENSKAVIQMTLTTSDDSLSKIIEPNVCTTKKRVKVLRKLNNAGIPTVVWLCPILPYINDSYENIKEILDYCIDVNVYGVICFEMGVTLRDGNRQYFYQKLDEHFPGLKEKYIRRYGNSYSLPSPNNTELMEFFKRKTSENNIENNVNRLFEYLAEFPNKDDSYQARLF